MSVRNVEWKLPYTWGKAITVDENTKVISLNLRDENNLIIYNQLDDEIYVDLQLPDWIRPQYAFPVGVTTGRVLSANDWDVTWTLLIAKTTSWDVIKLLYWDDGKLYIDNGTGIFKQVYLKPEVDALLAVKQDKLIAWENIVIAPDWKTISAISSAMSTFLSLWDCSTGEPLSFHGSLPYEYKTWDYFLVETVDSTTNYRPNWVAYDGTASQVVETEEVAVWDVYIYDGAVWLLQINHGKTVSFANLAGQPSDNPALDAALNAKANKVDVLSKTNTTAYTPSNDYNPATKKYVDDAVGAVDEFEPGNAWTTWQVLKKTANGYEWGNETPGWVTSVNGQTWAVTVDEFEPESAWTTWQVLKKTATGYDWANGGWWGGWIQLSPDSPLQLDYLWAGYEDDYANVRTYGDTTAYLVVEWNNPSPGFPTPYAQWLLNNSYSDEVWSNNLTSGTGNSWGTLPDGSTKYLQFSLTGGNSRAANLPSSLVSFFQTQHNFTFSCWLKNTTSQTQWKIFYIEGTDNFRLIQRWVWDYDYGSNAYSLSLWDGYSAQTTYVTETLTNGTWYYLTTTYDHTAKEIKYYINGQQVWTTKTVSNDYVIFSSWGKWWLCRDYSSSWQWGVSDVAIYDEILDDTQIASYYDNTKSKYGIS